jgi:drug/metabolite transporter (DMT)-like permease
MSHATPAGLRPIDAIAALAIVACCASWGVNQVAIKVANEGIPPLLQAGLRSLLSGLLLLGWAGWRGIPLFRRDGTLTAGLMIGVLFTVDFLLLYPALSLTSASHGVLFLYAMPLFVALGAHVFVPGDRLTGARLCGLAVAFVGLGVALSDQPSGASAGPNPLLGDLMCVGAAASWAASTILLRTTSLKAVSAEKSLFYQLAVSAPLLAAASLLAGEPAPSFTDPAVMLAFAYTIAVVAFASYVAWFWLLTRHSPSAVSSFTFLTPIFGAVAGATLLGEPLTPTLLTALALVAAGIYLVSRPVK